MPILSFKAENWRRLKVVELTLNPTLNRFTGANYNGKTSALDALKVLLGGKRAMQGIETPVHDGADEANLECRIVTANAEYVVSAVVQQDRTIALKVQLVKGGKLIKQSSPIDILNDLTGGGGVDVMKFANADAKAQRKMLGELLGIDPQLKAFAAQYQEAFEERTDVNRRVKNLTERTAAGLPDKTERVDVSALFAEIEAGEQVNQEIAARGRVAEKLTTDAARLDADCARWRAEAAALMQKALSAEIDASVAREALAAADVGQALRVDVAPLKAQIQSAQSVNERAAEIERQHTERAALLVQLKAAEKESAELTTALGEIETARDALMAGTPMPLPEISMTEDAVLYKGKHFPGDASSAEKAIVSFAVMTARKPGQAEPEVKVALLYQASELDTASMATVSSVAEERGYQLLAESVDESGEVGFYIEDGMVGANNYAAGIGAE